VPVRQRRLAPLEERGVAAALERCLCRSKDGERFTQGHTPVHPGSIQWGNVTGYSLPKCLRIGSMGPQVCSSASWFDTLAIAAS
jgi:hypothetical protein